MVNNKNLSLRSGLLHDRWFFLERTLIPLTCSNDSLQFPSTKNITTITMKSSIALLALAASSVSAFAPSQSSSKSVTEAGLSREEILAEPNHFEFGQMWDPLGLAELGGDETIAWFRHAEVKHGRVAMAAFVGWTAVAGAGIRFPGELAHGVEFSSLSSRGLEAWDAVPGWGKSQMLLFAGLIEFHDELFYSRRGTHYMKGGIPGKVSTTDFDSVDGICIV